VKGSVVGWRTDAGGTPVCEVAITGRWRAYAPGYPPVGNVVWIENETEPPEVEQWRAELRETLRQERLAALDVETDAFLDEALGVAEDEVLP
jgi:hypothetical protein